MKDVKLDLRAYEAHLGCGTSSRISFIGLVILSLILLLSVGQARAISGAQDIEVTPTNLNFGSASVGDDPQVRYVKVENLGGADLVLDAVTINGADSRFFALDHDYSGFVLSPASSATPVDIAVAWLPIASGIEQEAELNIFSNDPDEPQVTIPLIAHLSGAISLNSALDNLEQVFTTGGAGAWFGQTGTVSFGDSAAQSMDISDNQNTWFETEIDGPKTLIFDWKVSSELNYDFLECYLDDKLVMRISGNCDWEQRQIDVSAGNHLLRWVYHKDVSVSRGDDAGWVDRIQVNSCSRTFYRDADGDGYGNPLLTVAACATPVGYALNSLDCNDNDALEHPGQTWYYDQDFDGYPKAATNVSSCYRPYGCLTAGELFALTADADDHDNTVYPGAPEICDGKDNDQNGEIDDGVGSFYYRDADGDGYGDHLFVVQSCATPIGYAMNSLDCDDTDINEHPEQTWYKDTDGDGYSDGTLNVISCLRPHAYFVASELVAVSGDHDDNDKTVYPGAPEICDGKDNDQNGEIDDKVGDFYFCDADGDGYGDSLEMLQSCTQPSGYVENGLDCNDADAQEHPDQNWYRDADGDGYPDSLINSESCTRPEGWFTSGELFSLAVDADDSDSTIYPGAFELCDGKDNDQDGSVDDECGIIFVSDDDDCGGRTVCYQTITDGCFAAAAWAASEIRVKAGGFYVENLDLNYDCELTLSGRWDQDYISNLNGQTTISGILTIGNGTVIVDGIVIEGSASFSQLLDR